MRFAFLQRNGNEDNWYVCTDLVRRDFEGGYNLKGSVVASGDDRPTLWLGSSVLFNTADWTCWEYETQEELMAKHLEYFL